MAGLVSRAIAAALMASCVGLGAACASHPPENAEELEAYRQDLRDSSETAGSLLQETRKGHNVSGFGMGMFAMTLLNELSTQDAELSRHIHADGRSTDLYLREVFQAHPAEEVLAVHSMADKGRRAARLAAQHVLEALRHIPDRNDTSSTQERDRRNLASELVLLQSLLDKAAAEATLSADAIPP